MLLEYEDDYYDPEDDYDFTEYDETRERIGKKFADGMRSLIMDIISLSGITTEAFTSDNNLRKHFSKHCIGHSTDKKSNSSNIYYNFTDNSHYYEYEKQITDNIRNTDFVIDSLDDYETIMKYMRKLFNGNNTVTFSKSCGFKGNNGPISISFSSYSSDVTTYGGGNTVDACIKGRGNNTVTLYPINAHKVENKLNSLIKRSFEDEDIPYFNFNND